MVTARDCDRDTRLPLAPVPGLIRAIEPHIPVLGALEEGAYIVDRNRQIIYWNPGAERITGFAEGEVVGRCCGDGLLNHVDVMGTGLCQAMCPLAHAMAEGREPRANVFFHHKHGHRVPTTVHALPLTDSDGRIVGAIELFTDAVGKTELAERVAELESLAYLDALTGLPNRRFASDALDRRLEECQRTGSAAGVAIFDIDHFKRLNDTRGHAAGDAILRIVGRTLMSVARRSDVIARWGGEEFAGILPHTTAETLHTALERLRTMVAAAWLDWEGSRVSVTVSIGATLSLPTDTPDSILQRADALLYRSKAGGRNMLTTDEADAAA